VYISQKSFAAEQNIDLTQVLTSIASRDSSSPFEEVACVHIYCDTLVYSSSDHSEFPRLEWLRIFARRLDGPNRLSLSQVSHVIPPLIRSDGTIVRNVKCLFLVVGDIPIDLEVSVAAGLRLHRLGSSIFASPQASSMLRRTELVTLEEIHFSIVPLVLVVKIFDPRRQLALLRRILIEFK
jgi:hypothetical protein